MPKPSRSLRLIPITVLGMFALVGNPWHLGAQTAAKGFSSALEAPLGGARPVPMTATLTTPLPPAFPLTSRSVVSTIPGQPQRITVQEGVLAPPPAQTLSIDVPTGWYLPVSDNLGKPQPKSKWDVKPPTGKSGTAGTSGGATTSAGGNNGSSGTAGSTGNPGTSGNTGSSGSAANSGNQANTGRGGNSAQSGSSGTTGNSGGTGSSAGSGTSAGSGNPSGSGSSGSRTSP